MQQARRSWTPVLVAVLAFQTTIVLRASDGPPVFAEEDGVLIVEVEAVKPAGAWAAQTEMAGFTGDCYYTWTAGGIDHGGSAGPLVYKLRITTPGKYHFRIRNRHDFEDSTEQNDCFTRMDDGKPTKTFSHTRGKWTWATNHEHHGGGKPPASYELTAGEHVFTICGRSGGFSIDRFVFYLDGKEAQATDLSRESTDGLPSMPKLAKLDRAARYWEEGRLGKAFAQAQKSLASDDAEEATEAKQIVEALRAHLRRQKERLGELKKRAPAAATNALEELADQYKYSEPGNELDELAKEWNREDGVRNARKANRIYAKLEEDVSELQRASGTRLKPGTEAFERRFKRELRKIERYAEELRADYPDTQACRKAMALVETVGIELE